MPVRYPVPLRQHRVEETIRRSRFITTLAPAPDADAARAFIDRIRAEFPDATHNCWAYVAGPPGSTGALGMSDAGEPHGTAGRPMLDVLRHSTVGEVAAVVTRYYGGIKLGKGGLARAYAGGVQHALETLPLSERVQRLELRLSFDYAHVDAVRKLIEDHDAELREERYGAQVGYGVAVPEGRVADFEAMLAEVTAGAARVARVKSG